MTTENAHVTSSEARSASSALIKQFNNEFILITRSARRTPDLRRACESVHRFCSKTYSVLNMFLFTNPNVCNRAHDGYQQARTRASMDNSRATTQRTRTQKYCPYRGAGSTGEVITRPNPTMTWTLCLWIHIIFRAQNT